MYLGLWAFSTHAQTQTQIVNALLDSHVPVDVQSTNGATALHWACGEGNLDAVRRLHKHGGDVASQTTDKNGEGLLHWASAAGKHRVVHHLVSEGGAKVGAKDAKGKTALHVAAEGGRMGDKAGDEAYADGAQHTVNMLVNQFAAPVSTTTGAGKTALQLATGRLEAAEKSGDAEQIESSKKVVSLLRSLTVEPRNLYV